MILNYLTFYTFVIINGVFASMPPTKRIPQHVWGPSRSSSIKNSRRLEAIILKSRFKLHTLSFIVCFFFYFVCLATDAQPYKHAHTLTCTQWTMLFSMHNFSLKQRKEGEEEKKT